MFGVIQIIFKVSFYFRLNESSPWQEYIYEFKVDYQARISLQDYNQQEIKYFYFFYFGYVNQHNSHPLTVPNVHLQI